MSVVVEHSFIAPAQQWRASILASRKLRVDNGIKLQ